MPGRSTEHGSEGEGGSQKELEQPPPPPRPQLLTRSPAEPSRTARAYLRVCYPVMTREIEWQAPIGARYLTISDVWVCNLQQGEIFVELSASVTSDPPNKPLRVALSSFQTVDVIPPPLPSLAPSVSCGTACPHVLFLKAAPTALAAGPSHPSLVVYLPPNRSPTPHSWPLPQNTTGTAVPKQYFQASTTCSDIFNSSPPST